MKFFVLIILIIRILLLFIPAFRIDMTDWQAWAQRLVQVGPTQFYSPDYFSDYFPGYLYILWFLGNSFNILFPQLPIFSLGFEIYLKAFTTIFDIATAYYIYKITSRYQKKLSLLAAIFYLANPAIAFNSSAWGQVDGILTFFLVYSGYSLLELKDTYRFSIFTALSLLVKPQGLAIFPIEIIYFFTHFKLKKYLSLFLIPVLLIILSLPFFLKDPVLGLFHQLQKSTLIYPFTSIFAYNFWFFFGWWKSDLAKFLGITYQTWGAIIFLITLATILGPLIIKKAYKNNLLIYFAMALSGFAFFLFLTRMHERYLFPFFAFLVITAFIKNSVKLMIIYIILSLIHLINLWYVYYYYNYVYSNPKLSSFFIYQFIDTYHDLFAFLALLGFLFLILIYYQFVKDEKNHIQKVA